MVIGWSWDFHQAAIESSYSNVPNEPSIFLRKVEPGPKLERARAVSGANVDTRPTIAVGPDGQDLLRMGKRDDESEGGGTRK